MAPVPYFSICRHFVCQMIFFTSFENMRDIEKKIRVSGLEEMILKSKADQAGMNLARFIRESALGNEITIRRMSPDEKKALLELSRIGNNLNQIAKKFKSSLK